MGGWGLFSLAVVAVPTIAATIWLLCEVHSSRRRRNLLRRDRRRSVSGIKKRIEHELSNEDTHVMPKIQRGSLKPDPLQDGHVSGYLPIPKRVREYTRQAKSRARTRLSRPDIEHMKRVLNGLRRLD
jgi:hypothetical protein